ncbi:MAG: hypothetical protein J6F30_12070 [Cellulosilyticum sp.]|nr:hypothetical protein [Cellulosilyticum sp.]
MVRKYYKKFRSGIFIFGILLGTTGCGDFISSSMIEVINQEVIVETFYGEGIYKTYIDNEFVKEEISKEWKGKNGKYHNDIEIRVDKEFYDEESAYKITEEMVQGDYIVVRELDTVTDKELIAYLPYQNLYCIKSMSLVAEVTDDIRVGIDAILFSGSLKEYVMELINVYEKDYVLTMEENVRLNNYMTQHIIAIPKDKSIDERYEFWIDQSNWLIVKEFAKKGNVTEEFEYTKYELNSRIDESVFEVDIPSDANIEYIYDNLEKLNQVVTLDEAVALFGKPVFYLDKEGLELEDLRYIELASAQYGQINLIYTTEDGNKVTVKNSLSSPLYEKLKLGYEQVRVRGVSANYIENNGRKNIEFIDDGVICSVYVENSEMSKDKLIEIVNHLKIKK